jgi:hypothetical protein
LTPLKVDCSAVSAEPCETMLPSAEVMRVSSPSIAPLLATTPACASVSPVCKPLISDACTASAAA